MSASLAGACGDWCGKCPNYPENCEGCGPKKTDCYFINCLSLRFLEHCGECPEFPCQRLSSFVPDDRPGYPPGYHIESLKRRKEIPLSQRLKKQEEYWKNLEN